MICKEGHLPLLNRRQPSLPILLLPGLVLIYLILFLINVSSSLCLDDRIPRFEIDYCLMFYHYYLRIYSLIGAIRRWRGICILHRQSNLKLHSRNIA